MEKFLIDKNTAWNTRAPNFSLNLNPCVPSSVLPSVLLLPLRRRWALWEGHCQPRHIQFHLRRRGLLVKRWCILRLLRRRRLRFFELRWLRVAGISSDCTDDSSFSSQDGLSPLPTITLLDGVDHKRRFGLILQRLSGYAPSELEVSGSWIWYDDDISVSPLDQD